MKKRIFSIISLMLVVMFLIAGCGGTGSSSGGQKGGEVSDPKDLKANLNFYYWDENQKPGMDKIVEAFNKIYPNVKITSTVIPWAQYWTKMQTSLPTSSAPDIFWLNAAHFQEYQKAGLLYDIQQFVDRDKVDLSIFPDSLKQLYSADGKLYSIPKDFDTIALFYNKELFDKAGVKYPDDTWTWDDLLNAAKKLTITDANGNITQYGFVATSGGQTCTYDWILANGGQILSEDKMKSVINTPESKEALQFLYDLMYVHKVSPTGAEQKETDPEKLFHSGTIAMMPHGSWFVPPAFEALGDKVDVAPLPKQKQRGNVIHGLGFTMSAKTKYPEAAWQFLKFCATKEAGEYQAGVVIPASKGAEEVWMKSYPSMNLKVFIDATEYAIPIPRAAKGASGADTVFENEMQNIWLQAKDVATALADCEKGMNDEIAKGK